MIIVLTDPLDGPSVGCEPGGNPENLAVSSRQVVTLAYRVIHVLPAGYRVLEIPRDSLTIGGLVGWNQLFKPDTISHTVVLGHVVHNT